MPVRTLSIALLTGGVVGACGADAEDAYCDEACAYAATWWDASVPDGGTMLSAYELQALGEVIQDTREGVVAVGDAPIHLCRDVAPCDEPVPMQERHAIPYGKYIAVGTFKVPPLGSWEVEVSIACSGDPGNGEPRVVPLVRGPDGLAHPILMALPDDRTRTEVSRCGLVVEGPGGIGRDGTRVRLNQRLKIYVDPPS